MIKHSESILIDNFIAHSPMACVLYEATYNDSRSIINFTILNMNSLFETITTYNSKTSVGKKITEVYSPESIRKLISAGNDIITSTTKRNSWTVNINNDIYKSTLLQISDDMFLSIYEEKPFDIYKWHYGERIPQVLLEKLISERKNHYYNLLRHSYNNSFKQNRINNIEITKNINISYPDSCCTKYDGTDYPFRDLLTGLFDRRVAIESLRMYVSQGISPLSVIMGDINGLKQINDTKGFTAGDKILSKVALTLLNNCDDNDIITRWGDDEFLIILPHKDSKYVRALIEKLSSSIEEACSDGCSTVTFGYAINTKKDFSAEEMITEAEKWTYRKKLLESQSYRNKIVRLLLSTLQENSAETNEHSDRMAHYCRRIATHLNLPSEMISDLVLLSMLHDIGKIGIRQELLNKPGPLSPEEREEIKNHPEIGYRITRNIPELSQISNYILSHHEKWDGSGYPAGLRGEEIPLPSRIIAVVDAFDVMVSGRSYRAARSKEEALEELKRCSGTQFDPKVVDIMVNLIEI